MSVHAARLAGIVTKTADMLTFLLKSHLYGNIDRLFAVVGLLSQNRGRAHVPLDQDS